VSSARYVPPVRSGLAALLLAATAGVALASPSPQPAVRLSAARVHAGHPLRVRVAEPAAAGAVPLSICLVPRAGAQRCRPGGLRAGVRARTVPLHAPRPGRWTVRVRTRTGHVDRRLRVLPRTGRLALVATGDSMIQYVDVALRRALPHTTVTSDAHVGTGLSKLFAFDWPAHARRQAHGRRQDVTVMFIGPNEGFPIGRARCCSRAWVAGYAGRALGMMRAWARGGAGQVYWLLLPAARDARFARIFRAVNAALRRAARSAPPGAELVDLARVLSPHGFRARLGGATIRQGDGIHLTPAGARIAARVVVRRMATDGVF
jgi:hypothetical protein